MAIPPSRPPRWTTIRDTLAFGLGSFIMIWQTVMEDDSDVTLVVAALVCLGVSGSGVAQRVIASHFPGGTDDGAR